MKEDSYWRKAKIAARILLKSQTRPLNARDRRLARQFAAEPGVSNRLLDQAVASLQGEKFQKERRVSS